jgi:kynureninase
MGPFGSTKRQFDLPEGLIHLDGNSLGPPPRAALAALHRLVEQEWRAGLARSWSEAGWWDAPVELGGLIAPLVGAGTDEVVVCDSISVNLFKVLTAGARLLPGRRVLLAEAGAFPTDRYLLESVAGLLGLEARLVAEDADLAGALDESVAVALISHVDYRTARRHDLAALTAHAHAAGALIVWDLAHSAGAGPVRLDDAGADFAVGCTYKYLNGGPGAPGFVYAARRHLEALSQPITGWNGHARPFAFLPDYEPDPGARRLLAGTPSLVAFAVLEAALQVWRDVDLDAVEATSRSLGALLIPLLTERCPGLELVSPADPARRGSHLAYRHADPRGVVEALARRQVIADAREPDIVRLTLAPLYLGHVDVLDAAARISEVLGDLC